MLIELHLEVKPEVHDEVSFQVLYHSHVQVVLRQTRHNLCFHQFLLYLVFQTQSFAILPLKRKAV